MAGGDLGNKLSKVNDIKLIYCYYKIVAQKSFPGIVWKKIDIDETQEMMLSRLEGATKECWSFKSKVLYAYCIELSTDVDRSK